MAAVAVATSAVVAAMPVATTAGAAGRDAGAGLRAARQLAVAGAGDEGPWQSAKNRGGHEAAEKMAGSRLSMHHGIGPHHQ